jgi:hypothetical protein
MFMFKPVLDCAQTDGTSQIFSGLKLNIVINHTSTVPLRSCDIASSARVLATKGHQLIEQHRMLKHS